MKAVILRSIAGGMGATIGIILSVGMFITIAILQSLKLLGGIVWAPEQAILLIVLAALVGFIWGIGVLKMRPSLPRAILGGIGMFALILVPLLIVRWLLNLEPWSLGTALLFGGFAAAFGVVWGMGGLNPVNQTVEAAHAAAHNPPPAEPVIGAFDPVKVGGHTLAFLRSRIFPIVRPLLGPAAIALGIALLVIVVVMVLGSLGPLHVVQTDHPEASAVTPAGFVPGVFIFDQPVSKTVFFLLIALIVLGAIGSMALGMALLVNALSSQVQAVKKLPNEPVNFSETSAHPMPLAGLARFFIRLAQFFTDWIAEITNSATGSISR